MKNLIQIETAVRCTECGMEICGWISKVLTPFAIGGGFIVIAAMLWKAVTV